MKASRIISVGAAFFLLLAGCTQQPVGVPSETASAAVSTNTTAQPTLGGEEPVKPYYPAKNMGSAKELVGDILVVSIFMETPKAKITPQLEGEILGELSKAGDWLENEAQKRGKSARIFTGKDDDELIIRYTHPKATDEMESISYDELLLILKKLKMGTYYSKITQKYNTQNIAFVFSLNQNGRSFATPSGLETRPESMLSDEASETDFIYLDACVMYTMCQWEPTDYGIYAHELLHLFGAADLYFEYYDGIDEKITAMNMEKMTLGHRYFSDEIMRGSQIGPIGDLTAYLIGWEETVPIKYAYFLYKGY